MEICVGVDGGLSWKVVFEHGCEILARSKDDLILDVTNYDPNSDAATAVQVSIYRREYKGLPMYSWTVNSLQLARIPILVWETR